MPRVRQETADAYARRILTNLFLNRHRVGARERVTAEVPSPWPRSLRDSGR